MFNSLDAMYKFAKTKLGEKRGITYAYKYAENHGNQYSLPKSILKLVK